MRSPDAMDVYLEIGSKRTFAGAIDWPGWCRSGRDEASALAALLEVAPRYARVLDSTRLGFRAPADLSAFSVVERLKGDATTDFGSPGAIPSSDAGPIGETELHRLQALLRACWGAFDAAATMAQGKELRKGPRGGGRELDAITQHVLGAEAAYLGRLGWKVRAAAEGGSREELTQARHGILEALGATAGLDAPGVGPRGGVRWPARYFVRRVAWHVLDHAWEIEDRISAASGPSPLSE